MQYVTLTNVIYLNKHAEGPIPCNTGWEQRTIQKREWSRNARSGIPEPRHQPLARCSLAAENRNSGLNSALNLDVLSGIDCDYFTIFIRIFFVFLFAILLGARFALGAQSQRSGKGNDPETPDRESPSRVINCWPGVRWQQKPRIPGSILLGIKTFLAG
jgi:hypothetical protein